MITIGSRIYGLAAVALGLVGMAWGDFTLPWQPVPEGAPGYATLAYVAAALFCVGGIGLQWRRSAPAAALLLAALALVFALCWSRRIFSHPEIFAVWSGTAEQIALCIGGLAAFACLRPADDRRAMRLALVCRLIFGLCLIAFGCAHFLYVRETAAMVPAWLPPGPRAWAWVTGGAHLLAGLALLSGVLDRLAARLLTLMFVIFGALVWAPQLFSDPHAHMAWGGNAINFALIGAAWAVADMIARFRPTLPVASPT